MLPVQIQDTSDWSFQIYVLDNAQCSIDTVTLIKLLSRSRWFTAVQSCCAHHAFHLQMTKIRVRFLGASRRKLVMVWTTTKQQLVFHMDAAIQGDVFLRCRHMSSEGRSASYDVPCSSPVVKFGVSKMRCPFKRCYKINKEIERTSTEPHQSRVTVCDYFDLN